MSREDYIAIAARLFAVYVVFVAVRDIPGTISVVSQSSGSGGSWSYVIATLVALSIATLLWFFPLTIARKLLPVMREPRSEKSVDAPMALSIGITLIGLWFLANAVADGVYWLTLRFHVERMELIGFEWSSEQIAGMATTVAQLVLALCLLLGSGGIRRLIYRYRYGRFEAGGDEVVDRS